MGNEDMMSKLNGGAEDWIERSPTTACASESTLRYMVKWLVLLCF